MGTKFTKKQQRNWTSEDIKNLVSLYTKQYSVKQIGVLLDRSPSSIRYKLENLGLWIRAVRTKPVGSSCSISGDCFKCTLPGCIEDGYTPNLSRKSYRKVNWTPFKKTELYRLSNTYSTDVLCNIFRATEESLQEGLDIVYKEKLAEGQTCYSCARLIDKNGQKFCYFQSKYIPEDKALNCYTDEKKRWKD